MSKNDYTTLIWCVILVLGVLLIVTMGTIIGIIAGIVVIIGFVLVVPRTYKSIKSWWLLRSPMDVTYLIPQSQYTKKQFIGAPSQEIKPNNITVGIGKYQLIILYTPKVTLTQSYPPYIEIVGDRSNKPEFFNLEQNPFIIEEQKDARGNISITDWHGVTVSIDPKQTGEKQYVANTVGLIARGIHTFGNWKGSINITWCVKETDKAFTTSLKLEVSELEEVDQIPFLKIKGG